MTITCLLTSFQATSNRAKHQLSRSMRNPIQLSREHLKSLITYSVLWDGHLTGSPSFPAIRSLCFAPPPPPSPPTHPRSPITENPIPRLRDQATPCVSAKKEKKKKLSRSCWSCATSQSWTYQTSCNWAGRGGRKTQAVGEPRVARRQSPLPRHLFRALLPIHQEALHNILRIPTWRQDKVE